MIHKFNIHVISSLRKLDIFFAIIIINLLSKKEKYKKKEKSNEESKKGNRFEGVKEKPTK